MVLPKSMRLKGYRYFDDLYKKGVRYNSSTMLLRVLSQNEYSLHRNIHNSSEESSLKLAVAISNKVSKKAVIRNKMRRLLHTHLQKRLKKPQLKCPNIALLSLKPNSSSKENSFLLNECDFLLKKAGLIQ